MSQLGSSPQIAMTPNTQSPRSAGTHARTPASRASSHIPPTPQSYVRSDLASGRRAPQTVPMAGAGAGPQTGIPSTPLSLGSSPAMPSEQSVWGTSVQIDTVIRQFTQFFKEFKDDTGEPLYPRLLNESIASGITNLNLNAHNLLSYDATLYKHLCAYPQEMIPAFDMVVDNERKAQFPDDPASETHRIQIRPFNLEKSRNMRELNPEDIDTLISIRGMVIRLGGIIPEMKRAHFQCAHCDATEDVYIAQGTIAEPTQCLHCRTRYSMQLIHNRCLFTDKQLIKIQETPDSIPEGETPHTINVFAYEDLVDVCKPGDRVEITGVYRAQSVRTNTRKTQLKTIFRTFLDALHFKKMDERRFHLEDHRTSPNSEFFTSFEETDQTSAAIAEREQKLRELGADPTIYDRLTTSLAPSVWELDDVKRGILCQLFGGTNHEQGAGHGRFRGELNVLMCGDPGTSKSQLLQYVHKIAPRGIYTSGKGSSAVGLTASIYKDPETREMILESGALVLSDRGICCIDEFDKMSDSTRSILHEVMEQQTVSIAKAGIVCTLNARTSILASANPKESRYNPKLSVVQNIQLMPTLLSRFDLIYLVLDQPNELKDRRLAKHIVSLYFDHPPQKQVAHIDTETLSAYISYARKNIHPKLSTAAEDQLIEAYVKMRKIGQNAQSKVVTATPRQLESLIRLSEALARMKLCSIVTREDVMEAQRLMSVATQTAATDPTTGQIDMDMITTGQSTGARQRLEKQIDGVREFLLNRAGRTVRIGTLLKEFNEPLVEALQLNQNEMTQILEALVSEGVISMGGQGRQADVIRKL